MGFMLVTALLSGVVVFLVSSLLDWVLENVTPRYAASLGHVARTVAVVAVATVAYIRHDPSQHRG